MKVSLPANAPDYAKALHDTGLYDIIMLGDHSIDLKNRFEEAKASRKKHELRYGKAINDDLSMAGYDVFYQCRVTGNIFIYSNDGVKVYPGPSDAHEPGGVVTALDPRVFVGSGFIVLDFVIISDSCIIVMEIDEPHHAYNLKEDNEREHRIMNAMHKLGKPIKILIRVLCCTKEDELVDFILDCVVYSDASVINRFVVGSSGIVEHSVGQYQLAIVKLNHRSDMFVKKIN